MRIKLDKFDKTLIVLDSILVLFRLILIALEGLKSTKFISGSIDFLEIAIAILMVAILVIAIYEIFKTVLKTKEKKLFIPIVSILILIIFMLLFFSEIKKLVN